MTKRHLVYKGTPLCTNIIIAYLSKKDELKAYNVKKEEFNRQFLRKKFRL